ncbi:hypothetical protein OH77DRAFT_1518802 [Trametes cingulata]|nr:hypothetical protein OH77DRAFT_1518802 [Trametes cingulata]
MDHLSTLRLAHPDFIFPKHLQLRAGNWPRYKAAVELTCLRYGLEEHLVRHENPWCAEEHPAAHARWEAEEDACRAVILCNIEDAEEQLGSGPGAVWQVGAAAFWRAAEEQFAGSQPEQAPWVGWGGWGGCTAAVALLGAAAVVAAAWGRYLRGGRS